MYLPNYSIVAFSPHDTDLTLVAAGNLLQLEPPLQRILQPSSSRILEREGFNIPKTTAPVSLVSDAWSVTSSAVQDVDR